MNKELKRNLLLFLAEIADCLREHTNEEDEIEGSREYLLLKDAQDLIKTIAMEKDNG